MHSSPVAIVTGSARGIGRGIVEQLSQDGFSVVVNYARSAAAADELVASFQAQDRDAIAVQADVSQPTDRERLLNATLERWQRVDLLVNNAGITSQGRNDILEATEASWDSVLDTNLKGPFFLTQQVACAMKDLIEQQAIPRGQIINISSISAFAGSVNRADYCIAKAGMTMMTELFAARLAEEQINVYEIAPGVIATDMTGPVKEKYDRLIAEGLSPIRRWGQPQDVAAAVSAISSGKFPFSTGEVFHVDGGFHLRRL